MIYTTIPINGNTEAYVKTSCSPKVCARSPNTKEHMQIPASFAIWNTAFAIPRSSCEHSMTIIAWMVGTIIPEPSPSSSESMQSIEREVQNLMPTRQISMHMTPITMDFLEPMYLFILPTNNLDTASVIAWQVKNIPMFAIPTVFPHVGRYVTTPLEPIKMKNNVKVDGSIVGEIVFFNLSLNDIFLGFCWFGLNSVFFASMGSSYFVTSIIKTARKTQPVHERNKDLYPKLFIMNNAIVEPNAAEIV